MDRPSRASASTFISCRLATGEIADPGSDVDGMISEALVEPGDEAEFDRFGNGSTPSSELGGELDMKVVEGVSWRRSSSTRAGSRSMYASAAPNHSADATDAISASNPRALGVR